MVNFVVVVLLLLLLLLLLLFLFALLPCWYVSLKCRRVPAFKFGENFSATAVVPQQCELRRRKNY